jgi:hypothetical protein
MTTTRFAPRIASAAAGPTRVPSLSTRTTVSGARARTRAAPTTSPSCKMPCTCLGATASTWASPGSPRARRVRARATAEQKQSGSPGASPTTRHGPGCKNACTTAGGTRAAQASGPGSPGRGSSQ